LLKKIEIKPIIKEAVYPRSFFATPEKIDQENTWYGKQRKICYSKLY